MTRYVTNIVDQRLSPNAPEWDGFAEITLDPTQPLFGTPEGERIVRDDIARFHRPHVSVFRRGVRAEGMR